MGSPSTAELRDAYLRPLGIGALLDAPIYLHGKVVGVVCHEHIGGTRQWNETEAALAACVADNIARSTASTNNKMRSRRCVSIKNISWSCIAWKRWAAWQLAWLTIFAASRARRWASRNWLHRIPELPPKAEQYCRRIIESLNRGQQLCKQVMEFGQDEPMFPRVLDVRGVVADLREMFKVLLGNSIELEIDICDPVSRVFMDPSQLERTLLNLVLNARDAMPRAVAFQFVCKRVTSWRMEVARLMC